MSKRLRTTLYAIAGFLIGAIIFLEGVSFGYGRGFDDGRLYEFMKQHHSRQQNFQIADDNRIPD